MDVHHLRILFTIPHAQNAILCCQTILHWHKNGWCDGVMVRWDMAMVNLYGIYHQHLSTYVFVCIVKMVNGKNCKEKAKCANLYSSFVSRKETNQILPKRKKKSTERRDGGGNSQPESIAKWNDHDFQNCSSWFSFPLSTGIRLPFFDSTSSSSIGIGDTGHRIWRLVKPYE